MDVKEIKESSDQSLDKIPVNEKKKIDPAKIVFTIGIIFVIIICGTIIARAWNYSALKKKT